MYSYEVSIVPSPACSGFTALEAINIKSGGFDLVSAVKILSHIRLPTESLMREPICYMVVIKYMQMCTNVLCFNGVEDVFKLFYFLFLLLYHLFMPLLHIFSIIKYIYSVCACTFYLS